MPAFFCCAGIKSLQTDAIARRESPDSTRTPPMRCARPDRGPKHSANPPETYQTLLIPSIPKKQHKRLHKDECASRFHFIWKCRAFPSLDRRSDRSGFNAAIRPAIQGLRNPLSPAAMGGTFPPHNPKPAFSRRPVLSLGRRMWILFPNHCLYSLYYML